MTEGGVGNDGRAGWGLTFAEWDFRMVVPLRLIR